jgi:hypothetical protein
MIPAFDEHKNASPLFTMAGRGSQGLSSLNLAFCSPDEAIGSGHIRDTAAGPLHPGPALR